MALFNEIQKVRTKRRIKTIKTAKNEKTSYFIFPPNNMASAALTKNSLSKSRKRNKKSS